MTDSLEQEEQPVEEQERDEQVVSTDDWQQQVTDAENRALRAQAELENYRKRSSRELEDQRKYAAVSLLRDLLGVVDNINRAIEAGEQSDDAASLLEGFRLVGESLSETLTRHGVSRIEAVGQEFDPNVHEAILQQPSEDVPPGHVIQVATEGYQLHDRVLRPAQVIVAQANS